MKVIKIVQQYSCKIKPYTLSSIHIREHIEISLLARTEKRFLQEQETA